MPPRILVAPDKFKGTLSADQAARCIAAGWRRVRPRDQLELVPITDGGDGFGAILARALGAQTCSAKTVDAAHRPLRATWHWAPESKTAILESARVVGLALLPPKRFHPFALDSFGLGNVLRAAAKKGAIRCLIGLGGSATNDGGFGVARALGWRFLGGRGTNIEKWTDLTRLRRIEAPPQQYPFRELIVAVDVRNPLLGPGGATRVYGPQKGLRKSDMRLAEQCLLTLAKVVGEMRLPVSAGEPGAGAAGGLGFGLSAFADGRIESGFDVFARLVRLERRLRSADLVITGEGFIDASTFMGKGTGELARLCSAAKVPCVALAGNAAEGIHNRRDFRAIHAITELTSRRESARKAALWLTRLAERAAREGPVLNR